MDTMSAFAMGRASQDNESMVFDWIKAAQMIRNSDVKSASAGLRGDWEYTGGAIFKNGKPVPKDETYVYLASTWAVPELKIDDVVVSCYVMQSEHPDWDANTYWPKEALKELEM